MLSMSHLFQASITTLQAHQTDRGGLDGHWPSKMNHCSLQVCTRYYLCLQKWKSLDQLYSPCTCHSRLAHSHQGTAVYIIRWKKIYKVWSDLWDPILRFKVRFSPDQVRSRSGPRWTLNRMSHTLLNFFFVYQCLLHSWSCDQPRSIFTSISFSLRRLTIWGQEALLRTVQ